MTQARDEAVKHLQHLVEALDKLETSRIAWAKKLGIESLEALNEVQAEYNAMAPVYAQQASQSPGLANPLQKQMDKLADQIGHVAELKSAMGMIDQIGKAAEDLAVRGDAVAAATMDALR